MAPVAPNYVYTDRPWIESFLSVAGVDMRLDDDGDGSLSAVELAYLTDEIVNSATERINFFLSPQYAPVKLEQSYYVWHACTICATYMLCRRRCNPIPESVQSAWDEAVEELTLIREGKARVPRVALRNIHTPAWSNHEVDFRYFLKKLRVQGPISEKSVTDYDQSRSRWADHTHHEV